MHFIILLAFVGSALAGSRPPSRIVGGTPTTVEEYPYMSNMQFHLMGTWWMQWCGGSLVTSRTVLSAAHCFYRDNPSQWNVRLGTSNASSGGSLHAVQQFRLHEQYDDYTLDNDIAIVVLATAAIFSNSIAVARIPSSTYILPVGTEVTNIGWGALSSEGSFPEQLQHVHINIFDQQLCAEMYAYLKTQPGFQYWPDITDGKVCAGVPEGGKDTCEGDAGGPLAHLGDVIYGVVSWGYGCAHEVYPGVNTRVSYYSNWVVENGSV